MPTEKKSPDSVFFLGCPPNTEVLGEQPKSKGLRLLLLDEQLVHGKLDAHSDVQGRFRIINEGTAKDYRKIYEPLVGRDFDSAAQALVEMNKIKETDPVLQALSTISQVLRAGRFKVVHS